VVSYPFPISLTSGLIFPDSAFCIASMVKYMNKTN
jgi:hypothetical protein